MSDIESFWLSDEGVLIRLEDLAHDFTFRTYNGALQAYFKESGFKAYEWITVLDEKVCKDCEAMHGRVYRAGQFLPRLPKHVGCRCMWDIYVEAVREEV